MQRLIEFISKQECERELKCAKNISYIYGQLETHETEFMFSGPKCCIFSRKFVDF